MRVSGSTPPLPPAVHPARSSGRPDPLPGASEPDAPAEGDKVHGLVRAAEHSHHSDVAALRQWINHPDLRGALSLPDLSAERQGNGFQKAVAAYQAIIGIGNPIPSTDPAPVGDPVVASDPIPSSEGTPVLDLAPGVESAPPLESPLPETGSGADA